MVVLLQVLPRTPMWQIKMNYDEYRSRYLFGIDVVKLMLI